MTMLKFKVFFPTQQLGILNIFQYFVFLVKMFQRSNHYKWSVMLELCFWWNGAAYWVFYWNDFCSIILSLIKHCDYHLDSKERIEVLIIRLFIHHHYNHHHFHQKYSHHVFKQNKTKQLNHKITILDLTFTIEYRYSFLCIPYLCCFLSALKLLVNDLLVSYHSRFRGVFLDTDCLIGKEIFV